ncbi:atos homolog protein A-like [Saccostrea echinata]|uniref:atos homolog protein A-like n=1 Tax=Saccostrea echinata TaxID=191078 RepID=UPI002A8189CC|nr:atos homolog protein A-like [Saccostrea echinata]
MKPETGSPDMEECVWDPVMFFVDVGILIVEARTPDLSPKGRSEGLHCPPAQTGRGVKVKPSHLCDLHREQCRRADQMKSQILGLSRNHIPLNIDVMLLPDCDHGRLEACSVDGSGVGSNDDLILLERWEILLQQKRSERVDPGSVTGRFLLQALRSYLHFSQLSSWLISHRGHLPLQIIYRLYSPGETGIHVFTSDSETHSFPIADLGTEILKVSVISLPRLPEIPMLLCQDYKNVSMRKKPSPERDLGLKVKSESGKLNTNKISSAAEPNVQPSPCVPEGKWSKKTEELRRTSPELFQDQGTSLTNLNQRTRVENIHQEKGLSGGQGLGAIPKKKNLMQKPGPDSLASKPPVVKKLQAKMGADQPFSPDMSELKMSFKTRPLPLLPDDPTNQKDPDFLIARLPSPKVLLSTAGKSNQTFYKKRHLDLSSPESFEDRVLTSKISSFVKPPNSEDLESYLASLTSHQPEKGTGTSLSNIPTMHCKFFDGDEASKSSSSMKSHRKTKQCLQESSASPSLAEQVQKKYPGYDSKQTPQKWNNKRSGTSVICDLQFSPESPSTLHTQKSYEQKHSRDQLETDSVLPSSDSVEKCEIKDKYTSSQRLDTDREWRRFQSPERLSPESSNTYSLFDDFVDDIYNIKPQSGSTLQSIPCVNSRAYVDNTESKIVDAQNPNSNCLQNKSDLGLTPDFHNNSNLYRYSDSKPSFKKSFSEPEMLGKQLTLCQLDELKLSPDENLSDLDAVLSKSFHDILSLDKSSSDSTPTNSLSESNGFKHYCDTDVGINSDRNVTISSPSKCSMDQDIATLANTVNNKCDGEIDSRKTKPVKSASSEAERNGFIEGGSNSGGCKRRGDLEDGSNRGGSQKNKSSLCKLLLRKELQRSYNNDPLETKFPTQEQVNHFQRNLQQSSSMVFNSSTGLPTRSSPAPLKRRTVGRFDYDNTLVNSRAIKNALSCSKLALESESSRSSVTPDQSRTLSTSAPASTNCLLGNFEESVLNGRIEPIGAVEGFTCDIGAGGSFCPKHVSLPVTAYFFQLSDDNAPSPYLGHINLESLGKKGYHIPKCGTVQVTLFNPNKTVIKMFVVLYDLSDMPPQSQTFLRQRTVYMPVEDNSSQPSYLRYLIHLRFASSKSGKIFLHTDIRVLFARDKFEFDPNVAKYELRSFTEAPSNPKFSPRR